MNKKSNIWENLILAAIILVIIQTFLEDFCRIRDWRIGIKHGILIAGFIFDLLFTIEFTIRSVIASRKKKWKHYFLYERGWIDLLASAPLLLLSSGPQFYTIVLGTKIITSSTVGTFNVLKIVKAVRVARILRIIRMLKIFGKIKNAESVMAQRHISVISTVGVLSIVFALILNPIISGMNGMPNFKNLVDKRTTEIKSYLNNIYIMSTQNDLNPKDALISVFSENADILKLRLGNEVLYERFDKDYINEYYDYDDLFEIEVAGMGVLYSARDINKFNSYYNILFLIMIVILVLAFLIIYTKHFVQTISDVIHVMNKGFSDDDYNFTVKIQEPFKNDDIYKLAQKYNEIYLPTKSELLKEKEKKGTSLSMDDFLGSMSGTK